jgi:hypothetical protein
MTFGGNVTTPFASIAAHNHMCASEGPLQGFPPDSVGAFPLSAWNWPCLHIKYISTCPRIFSLYMSERHYWDTASRPRILESFQGIPLNDNTNIVTAWLANQEKNETLQFNQKKGL